MSAVTDLNLRSLEANMVWLIPAFTHKFDFSEDKDYTELVERAYKAAIAVQTKARALLTEAQAKDAAEAARLKAIEDAKPKPVPEPEPVAQVAPNADGFPVPPASAEGGEK